jgi:hypothetical protein
MGSEEIQALSEQAAQEMFVRFEAAGLVIIKKEEYDNLLFIASKAVKISRDVHAMSGALELQTHG